MATPALTPKALLESLHEHLTAQTALLPGLHAQLGLPPVALSAELEQLRAILAQTVEAQITTRQKEVSEWMEKCEDLEKECTKHVKALGIHAKGIPSVGELRKQQILPKRHEMLTSHQDKLLNIYQAKHDQLIALSNRLHSLGNTLGSGFFPPDILSSRASLDASLQDVTPDRFSKLEKELVRGKSELARRLSQFSTTVTQIIFLYCDLGMSIPSADVASTLVDEKIDPRELIIARHAARIDEAEDEGLGEEVLGVEGVDPTVDLMEWAEALKIALEDEKTRREDYIQGMYDQLEILWKRLGVEEQETDAFVEENSGTAPSNVQAYEAELERMLELKRQSMSIFIVNARTEIESLWDDLILGEEERQQFSGFWDDEHTEELLSRHEEEILRLKEERRSKATLLASIHKYFEICNEEKELAAAASDQSRLLGRGPRDPGRLLREEKMRKRVKKEKPRLEQELMASIPMWERENGKAFLVNGARVVDVLAETMESEANNKENKRRAGSTIPSRATTPAPAPSRKHTVTPSVSGNGPNKRQRVAPASGGSSSYIVPPPSSGNRQSTTTPTFGASSSRAPFSARNGREYVPPVPPIPGSKGKDGGSSLPRPVSRSPVKSFGPGGIGLGIPNAFASRPAAGRVFSGASVASSDGTSSYGRRRSRRESFKPRASVDGFSFSKRGMPGIWGGGHEEALQEENEDF